MIVFCWFEQKLNLCSIFVYRLILKMNSFDNRRWMYKKFESDSVVSQDWVNNVVQFVQICGSNPLVEKNEKGMMRCPCAKCKNQKF